MPRWLAVAALSATHHAAAFHVALRTERGAALRPRPSSRSLSAPSARYREAEEGPAYLYDESIPGQGQAMSVSSLPEVLELSIEGSDAGADEGAGQGVGMAADTATPGGLERDLPSVTTSRRQPQGQGQGQVEGQGGMADVYRRRALLLTDQLQRMRRELGKVVASKQPSDQQLREVVTDTLREDNRALLLAQKELSEQR